MALVGDLDTNRAGIDVFVPRPGTFARMPGTAGFRHELDDAPVLEDEIMAGDLAFGIAEP
ncbi:hypothetical protein D3C86_2244490 [compost metagenome]